MTAWAKTSPLADQLFDEWNSFHSHTTHHFGTLGELTGDEAVNLIRQPQAPEQRDALLLELLTLEHAGDCLLYTSPSPRDKRQSRMPSSA